MQSSQRSQCHRLVFHPASKLRRTTPTVRPRRIHDNDIIRRGTRKRIDTRLTILRRLRNGISKGHKKKIFEVFLQKEKLPMPVYNAVTDNATGRVVHWGSTPLTPGPGQTLHLDVGRRTSDVEWKYWTVNGLGQLVEMTPAQRAVVDLTEQTANTLQSTGALRIHRAYDGLSALPATPASDGLIVVVHDSTQPTNPIQLAVSYHGQWWRLQTVALPP